MKEIEARYQCRLKSSNRGGRYLIAIADAMKARADGKKNRTYRPLAVGVITAALVTAASQAPAQAWVPPAGAGSVSVSVQQIRNTGHLLTDGSRLDDGKSL